MGTRQSAKFAQLFLQGGYPKPGAEPLFTLDFFYRATGNHVDLICNEKNTNWTGYGYFWRIDTVNNYYYNVGQGGQYMLISPEKDRAIAITSTFGNSDLVEAIGGILDDDDLWRPYLP